MIRAVNTGVINVSFSFFTLLQHSDVGFQLSLAVQESAEKISREEQAKRAKKIIPGVDNNNDVSKNTIIEENGQKK
jgi:hypothetical protein